MFTASLKRNHKRIGRGFLFIPLRTEGKATPGVKAQQGQANGCLHLHICRAGMLSIRTKLAWPIINPLRPLSDLTLFPQIDKAIGMYQQNPSFHQSTVSTHSLVSLPPVYNQPAWCAQECFWGTPWRVALCLWLENLLSCLPHCNMGCNQVQP